MGKKEGRCRFLFWKRFFAVGRNIKLFALCALMALTILMAVALPWSMQLVPDQSKHKGPEQKSVNSDKCRWRPEPLQGICDIVKPTEASAVYHNAVDCEAACCEDQSCYSFQYRAKEGCMWGVGDARLGAEKDGPAAWCEPRAPAQWKGQWIKSKDDGVPVLPNACDDDGWNPNELSGQCFGLGSRRQSVKDHSPESFCDACCADTDCRIWQWTAGAGCFYHTTGFGCKEANPLDFEPFIGKRKVQPGRNYSPYAYSEDFADMAGFENVERT